MPSDGESSSHFEEEAVDPNLPEAKDAAPDPDTDDEGDDEVDLERDPVPPRTPSEPEVRSTALWLHT